MFFARVFFYGNNIFLIQFFPLVCQVALALCILSGPPEFYSSVVPAQKIKIWPLNCGGIIDSDWRLLFVQLHCMLYYQLFVQLHCTRMFYYLGIL